MKNLKDILDGESDIKDILYQNKKVKSITFRISEKAHNKMLFNKMRYQTMSSIINECLEKYHDLKKEFDALLEEWETMPKGD